MMGQSNMLGEGKKTGPGNSLEEAVHNESKYPYLWDKDTNTWAVSKTVRSVFVMGGGGPASAITLQNNEFMTAATDKPPPYPGMKSQAKSSIGPELGIGFALGGYTPEPIMTLKSCIGNRALGWDILPPGSPRRNYTDPATPNETWIYAAYHETPHKWLAGSVPVPRPWNAGVQYDGDIYRANKVLSNMSAFYPGAKCYEVAGFFWWQGNRDEGDAGDSHHYEVNLVHMIHTLRTQYGSPKAKFVAASLGETAKGDTDNGGLILDAVEAISNATKYPEFAGNVASVYTHPLMHTPGRSGGHYGKDAQTYMNVGQAMGMAMVNLLKGDEQ